MTDVLNPALTPVSQGRAGYNSANQTLTWPAVSLAPGKGLTLTFTARASSDKVVIASQNGMIATQAAFASSLGGGTSNAAWALPPYSLYLPAVRKTSSGNGPAAPAVTLQITPPAVPAGQGEGGAGAAMPPPDWWSKLQSSLAAAWRQIFGRP